MKLLLEVTTTAPDFLSNTSTIEPRVVRSQSVGSGRNNSTYCSPCST